MYSAISYWYARPGARSGPAPAPDEATKPMPTLPASR
jgi:hypothetical protein